MLEVINSYINNSYGSKRGLLNYCWYGVQQQFGAYNRYRRIDWSRVKNVVFICHGNICRSPLGEALARQRFELQTESYGLDCRDGAPADERAVRFSEKLGIDLTQHASRHIRQYQPSENDLVVVMEPKHLAQLPTHIVAKTQVSLIGLWLSGPHPYVHDPYTSKDVHFDRCEQAVVFGTEGIATRCQNRRL